MDVEVGMKVFLQTLGEREYAGVIKFVSKEWIDIIDIHKRKISIRISEIKLIQEEE